MYDEAEEINNREKEELLEIEKLEKELEEKRYKLKKDKLEVKKNSLNEKIKRYKNLAEEKFNKGVSKSTKLELIEELRDIKEGLVCLFGVYEIIDDMYSEKRLLKIFLSEELAEMFSAQQTLETNSDYWSYKVEELDVEEEF